MRSNLEFRSTSLDDDQGNDNSPRGQSVARLIAARLPDYGFVVNNIACESWGWSITIASVDFTLLIGCGAYPQYPDGHLCFIEPKENGARRWFRRTSSPDAVERLATAIEKVIQQSGKATDFRWWTEEENAQGYASLRGDAARSAASAR